MHSRRIRLPSPDPRSQVFPCWMPVFAQSTGGETHSSCSKKTGAATMMHPIWKSPECCDSGSRRSLSLIHISEPTRLRRISYAVFCLKKKKQCKERTNRSDVFLRAAEALIDQRLER